MKYIVKDNLNERIDKYLSNLSEYNRSTILKLIKQEKVLVNKEKTKPSYQVKENDIIEITDELDINDDIVPENIPLNIVFENENVILINKPSNMVVHPGSGNKNHTLVNALMAYTKELSSINDSKIRPGIVHRIDKDTSGLILIAKNNKAHEILAHDFKEKNIQRKYIALVKGELKNKQITIDAPIGRDEKNRQRMKVTEHNSKNAITHVKVLKRYKNYTLVECQLETGRTHQIRVHLAYIGYPIFNDPIYQNQNTTPFGQFLHSSEITFKEPITKEIYHFTAPLPSEFKDFLNTLEEIK